ncbi:MAG: lasso peptide isopeptide bond-forming cyclase [Oscillochloris sp.]|nr:lasso peptide isopeptide bond-forming cyclase [Oscillochloris sp.]
MSAIVGIYNRDARPVQGADLATMLVALAHRGPDRSAQWRSGPIGLGHGMLHTTPESLHEQLPLVSRDGSLVISADARIDNRAELIANLGLGDRSASADSELILAAYARWGTDCPRRLLGDFSFAIWDARQQRLFCARDHLGAKPFYYTYSSQWLAFGSEIKALLALPTVSSAVDEVAIAYYLEGAFEEPTRTFFRDIVRLPAAHTLIISRESVQTQRYWAPDATHELRLGSDAEYAEGFREAFREAVRCRLRSAFPIGCTLSGGLDSSSVACVARDLLRQDGRANLHTFSAIFPDLPARDLHKVDEQRYIEAVLQTGGFQPHYTYGDRLSPLHEAERIMRHLDMAITSPNAYITWEIYRTAQQQQVRVMLDGCEGDITVSHGFEYLAELLWRGRWPTLSRELTALARESASGYTPRRFLWEYGARPLIPETLFEGYHALRRRLGAASAPASAISPGFARRVEISRRIRSQQRQSYRLFPTARELHRQDIDAVILPNVAETADKIGAAFQIESRHPFFDKRLVEFCLSLPADQKLHQGWTRAIMRHGMAGILPHDVQWRRHKSTFSPNLWRKLLEHERPQIDTIIHNPDDPIARYVDFPQLQRSYQRYTAQTSQPSDNRNVYQATLLSLWLQTLGLGHSTIPRYEETKEVPIR